MVPIRYDGWTLPYSQPEDVLTSIVVNFIKCKVHRRQGCKDSSIDLPSSSEVTRRAHGFRQRDDSKSSGCRPAGNGHWLNMSELKSISNG